MPAAAVDAYAIVVNHVWLHCIKPDNWANWKVYYDTDNGLGSAVGMDPVQHITSLASKLLSAPATTRQDFEQRALSTVS